MNNKNQPSHRIAPATKSELNSFIIEHLGKTTTVVNRDIPDYLYRYCSVNGYLIDDLQNSKITLVSPTKFNDVYDSVVTRDSIPNFLFHKNCLEALGIKMDLPISTIVKKRYLVWEIIH